MVKAFIFLWLSLTNSPTHIDHPRWADRVKVQKEVRTSRPAYAVYLYFTTDKPEEAYAVEDMKSVRIAKGLNYLFYFAEQWNALTFHCCEDTWAAHLCVWDFARHNPHCRELIGTALELDRICREQTDREYVKGLMYGGVDRTQMWSKFLNGGEAGYYNCVYWEWQRYVMRVRDGKEPENLGDYP